MVRPRTTYRVVGPHPTAPNATLPELVAERSEVGRTGSEAKCGRYTGTGLLEQRRRSGPWEPGSYGSGGRVTCTVTVYDGGMLTSCQKKVCKTSDLADLFGIAIVGVPTPSSPSDRLPQVGAPVKLRSGSLRAF